MNVGELTVTEALAELKTLGARKITKRGNVRRFIAHHSWMIDPLDSEGGSKEYVRRERQALADLELRHVRIRTAIQRANQTNQLTILDRTMSVAEWLNWRKEVAKEQLDFARNLQITISQAREQIRNDARVREAEKESGNKAGLVANLDEAALASEIEEIERLIGDLDGRLSLFNATTTVAVD